MYFRTALRRTASSGTGTTASGTQAATKTASAALPKAPPSSPNDTSDAPRKPSRTAVPVTSFRPLPVHGWQRRVVALKQHRVELTAVNEKKVPTTRVEELSEPLLFHGSLLGPRPIVVLGSSVESNHADRVLSAAKTYEALLSQAQWSHGAIYIPTVAAPSTAPPDLLSQQCDRIANVLDTFGVNWTHFLCHGIGALVAAKMTFRYPTRIGTLSIIDTPLVQKTWMRNAALREEIALALQDVNVPPALLDERVSALKHQLEQPLPAVTADDRRLYEELLFEKSHWFGSSGGLTRDDTRYLSVAELTSIKHPMHLIVPSPSSDASPLCDVALHREVFGIGRVQPIKGAASSDDILLLPKADSTSVGAATIEAGAQLEQWLSRYEADNVVARRYEQAARDMRIRMQATESAAAAGAQKGDAAAGKTSFPPAKKKEQKKKN